MAMIGSGGRDPLLSPAQIASYVREIQTYLRALSRYNLTLPRVSIDGVYGPETAGAVRTFQEQHGLDVTGEVDPLTWTAIYAEYQRVLNLRAPAQFVAPFPSPDTVIRQGDTGDLVVIVQMILRAISERFSGIPFYRVDGIYSETDVTAVKNLQQRAGLAVTGEVDRDTWNALVDTYNHIHDFSRIS